MYQKRQQILLTLSSNREPGSKGKLDNIALQELKTVTDLKTNSVSSLLIQDPCVTFKYLLENNSNSIVLMEAIASLIVPASSIWTYDRHHRVDDLLELIRKKYLQARQGDYAERNQSVHRRIQYTDITITK